MCISTNTSYTTIVHGLCTMLYVIISITWKIQKIEFLDQILLLSHSQLSSYPLESILVLNLALSRFLMGNVTGNCTGYNVHVPP